MFRFFFIKTYEFRTHLIKFNFPINIFLVVIGVLKSWICLTITNSVSKTMCVVTVKLCVWYIYSMFWICTLRCFFFFCASYDENFIFCVKKSTTITKMVRHNIIVIQKFNRKSNGLCEIIISAKRTQSSGSRYFRKTRKIE